MGTGIIKTARTTNGGLRAIAKGKTGRKGAFSTKRRGETPGSKGGELKSSQTI